MSSFKLTQSEFNQTVELLTSLVSLQMLLVTFSLNESRQRRASLSVPTSVALSIGEGAPAILDIWTYFFGEHVHNTRDTQNKIFKGQKVLFLLQSDKALHDQLPKTYKNLQPHKSLFFAKWYVVAVQSLRRPID